MGKALNIIANAAVAAAATAAFGPIGTLTLWESVALAAVGSPALGVFSGPLPSKPSCRSSTPS